MFKSNLAVQENQVIPALSIVPKPVAMSAAWYELKVSAYAILWYKLQIMFDAEAIRVDAAGCAWHDDFERADELRYRLWLAGAFFGLERAPAGIRAKEWAVVHFLAMPIEHRLKFGTVYRALDYFKQAG